MRSMLIFGLTACILTACMKKQNLDDPHLGPAISADEIQGKMEESLGPIYLKDIRKNEISSLTKIQILEDNQATKIFHQDLYVTALHDDPSQYAIDFIMDYTDFIDTINTTLGLGFRLSFDKNPTASSPLSPLQKNVTAKNVQAQTNTLQPVFLSDIYSDFSQRVCRLNNVSCHNLSIDSTKKYIPADMASVNVCPDVNNCFLDVKVIQYDVMDSSNLDESGNPERSHVTFNVVPQLPALSKVFKYCLRGLGKASGIDRKVLVETCYVVDNFSYGQEP